MGAHGERIARAVPRLPDVLPPADLDRVALGGDVPAVDVDACLVVQAHEHGTVCGVGAVRFRSARAGGVSWVHRTRNDVSRTPPVEPKTPTAPVRWLGDAPAKGSLWVR